MPTLSPIPFRIKIGVTGHRRDLHNTDGLKINFPAQ